VTASLSIDTLGRPEMTRFEKKIPYAAVVCQRDSASSSPAHVVAIPVGPTGATSLRPERHVACTRTM